MARVGNVFLVTSDNLQYGLPGPTKLTELDGSFRLEQLVPDDTVSVFARTKTATTGVSVSVRPGSTAGARSAD